MKENIRALGILVFMSEKMFMIDLSFHLCLEQKKPDDCIVNIPILKNAKLAKPFCNWNMGYIKSGDKYYISH
jgi:hypothetical protein